MLARNPLVGRHAARAALLGAAVATAVGGWTWSCAHSTTEFGDEGGGGTGVPTGGGSGGAGQGATGGSTASTSTTSSPCGIDCSTIVTDGCHQGVCNPETSQCEVVEAPDGTACEDGLFCTIQDSCLGGICKAGPPNDCGKDPPACTSVTCNEPSKSCATAPAQNGTACTPDDPCQLNAKCTNGLCVGQTNDCFFAPVPDECHVAVCNSKNGKCEPVPGNDGQPCTDSSDLCTVSKTCASGVCQGGKPKDCSSLSQGCNVGVCEVSSGKCVAKAVNNGDPCDDLDACTTGEKCNAGTCTGGAPVTACQNADGCCPAVCSELNDDDCGCGVNLGPSATPSHSSGGSDSYGYGPKSYNDGVDEQGCQQKGCSSCFGWVDNSTTPSGTWIMYEWPSAQQIGSIYVDSKTCNSSCGATGRTLYSGQVEYWNGTSWVLAQSFTGKEGDIALSFSPKLNTTKLRIYNMTAGPSPCGSQQSNSIVFEWYVYSGANCTP